MRYDVVILGGGLAGLSLARHLLLETDKTMLLLERRDEIPGPRQKVGESTVQLAGYYLSKILDLEEHLLTDHFLKYNLRFYWRAPGRDGTNIEDYSQSYIRTFSNVASYQVDRNRLEAELLAVNRRDPRFAVETGVTDIAIEWGAEEEPHAVSFVQEDEPETVEAGWVVDATGRARLTAKRRRLTRSNRVRNGSFFWWVDGRVDLDRLTDLTPKERRLRRDRAQLGHLPAWLATNHLVGDGFWFWVIPLQGKTSLGLVFDTEVIDPSDVFSVEKATAWICERFPFLVRDLPHREVLDFAGFRTYSHDCLQTLSAERWAMTGEAGRFSDPLYSPGSDLIALHNTMIVHAMQAEDPEDRRSRVRSSETLLRAMYEAYMPSYSPGYRALGDPEVFALKYSWELAVYFAAYVFPFINDLFTDRRFLPSFFRFFSALGPLNHGMQEVLTAYARWKEQAGDAEAPPPEPRHLDFTEIGPLAKAEKTFYKVGVTVEEARRLLDEQLTSLRELARFALVHVAARVVGESKLVQNRAFVDSLDPEQAAFDPEGWRELAARASAQPQPYDWSLDPNVLDRYRRTPAAELEEVAT